jgi:CRISPR-associated protein Cas6
MSVWQENTDAEQPFTRANMSDAVFKINCQYLPVDHAAALAEKVAQTVPWLPATPGCGVHPIHVAGSQNGWQRPDADSDEPLVLSKRTRLRIRVKTDQADALIASLCNTSFSIGSHTLQISEARLAPLQAVATLFARYVVFDDEPADEDEFLQRVIKECNTLGYQPVKLLCGKSHTVATPNGKRQAKSLLIADVPREFSLPLQERGIGSERMMGCGLLIPHKSTDAVS